MEKDLIKSFLVYGVGDAFSKLVPFLLLPFFTEVLIPAEYGVLEIINTIILILAVLGRLQLDTSLQRFYYEEKNQQHIVSTLFWIISFISIILATIVFIFSQELSTVIFETDIHSYLIKLACIVVVLMNINSYFSIVCRYLNLPIHFAVITFAGVLLNGLLALYLVYYLKIGLTGILYGQILGFFVTSCLFMLICKKYIRFNFVKALFDKSLKFSLPSFPAAILAVFNTHINKFLILYFLTEASVGIYSIALSIGSGVNIVVGAFSLVWYPFMYKNYNTLEGKKLIQDIYYLLCFLVMLLIILLSCFIEDILPYIIKNEAYQSAFYLVAAISLYFFYRIIKFVLDSSILIKKKTGLITVQYLVTLGVNVTCLLLLIKNYELIGVVIAMVVATVVMMVVSFYFSKKMNLFSFNGFVLAFSLGLACVVVFLNLHYDFDFIYRMLFIVLIIGVSILFMKKKYNRTKAITIES